MEGAILDEGLEFLIGELIEVDVPFGVIEWDVLHCGEHPAVIFGKSGLLLCPALLLEERFVFVSLFGDIAVMFDVEVFDPEFVGEEFLNTAALFDLAGIEGWVRWEGIDLGFAEIGAGHLGELDVVF